ncbi:PQQ-binding-like beta-propeller repeat protein [Micromonospora sp. WMMD1082]|uniref:outer membrane protein assembly factor BamB family protein n=1 Tax=Micromonospora sp. WMMD1082 TaxID=3016104 RepID=UPI0024166A25|nr:PQQ-binding-like beta-propeller repeat protein [Micromonospora sp. WMMD1082]MDG4792326.1 PQQ-binding-like beta-propeller repeat protein [Micromonospora sp. WMMD1082]
MTVIDLGELSGPTEPEPPPRQRPAGRRRPAGNGNRWWRVGLVALAALVALTGAAPPATRVHATVPAGLGSDLFFTEEYLFTATPARGVTDGRQEFVAYRRPTRATVAPQQLTPLWKIPLPHGVRLLRVEAVADGGVLLAMMLSESTGGDSRTLLLDLRTGQERWRTAGIGTPDASGRVLLETFSYDEPIRLRAVELADGREVWSTMSPPSWVAYHRRDGVIDAIVLSSYAGDVEVRDATTGRVRDRLALSHDDPDGYQRSSLIGDLVLVVRNSQVVHAYSIDGLVPRWQTTLPLADHVSQCGAFLCVQASGDGAYALDPATGAVRWHTAEDVEVLRVAATSALAQLRASPRGVALVALDAATGAVATDYGGWDAVSFYEDEPWLLGVRQIPDVGVVLARLDPAESQPRRLDVLPGVVRACHTRFGLIACPRQDGSFGVWQLPD